MYIEGYSLFINPWHSAVPPCTKEREGLTMSLSNGCEECTCKVFGYNSCENRFYNSLFTYRAAHGCVAKLSPVLKYGLTVQLRIFSSTTIAVAQSANRTFVARRAKFLPATNRFFFYNLHMQKSFSKIIMYTPLFS